MLQGGHGRAGKIVSWYFGKASVGRESYAFGEHAAFFLESLDAAMGVDLDCCGVESSDELPLFLCCVSVDIISLIYLN